jgi:hypothetical protein
MLTSGFALLPSGSSWDSLHKGGAILEALTRSEAMRINFSSSWRLTELSGVHWVDWHATKRAACIHELTQ